MKDAILTADADDAAHDETGAAAVGASDGSGEPLDQEQLRRRLRAAMDRHQLSQSSVKQRTGVSGPRLSQWLSGKYAGDNEKVAEQIARFLDQLDSAAGVQALAAREPGFHRTETADRIWAMLMQAQHMPAMVVAAGVPGVGKTMTAEAYRAAGTSVWLATMTPMIVSPSQVMVAAATKMGLTIGDQKTLVDRMGERMQGSGGLLVIDEAQHLNAKALDMVRSLYDLFGIGIALIGNHGFFAGTTAPSKTHGFAQFYRRIRLRARFGEPTKGDIETILDAWGIAAPDQRAFLALVGTKMWGLSGIGNCIHQATTMALGAGEPLQLRHLKAAWAGLNHYEG